MINRLQEKVRVKAGQIFWCIYIDEGKIDWSQWVVRMRRTMQRGELEFAKRSAG